MKILYLFVGLQQKIYWVSAKLNSVTQEGYGRRDTGRVHLRKDALNATVFTCGSAHTYNPATLCYTSLLHDLIISLPALRSWVSTRRPACGRDREGSQSSRWRPWSLLLPWAASPRNAASPRERSFQSPSISLASRRRSSLDG